jgi:hypothetical protein
MGVALIGIPGLPPSCVVAGVLAGKVTVSLESKFIIWVAVKLPSGESSKLRSPLLPTRQPSVMGPRTR